MLKFIASILLGAIVASAPLPAFAQTTPNGASTVHHPQTHRGKMAHRNNLHKERARAGAEHVRQMRVQ